MNDEPAWTPDDPHPLGVPPPLPCWTINRKGETFIRDEGNVVRRVDHDDPRLAEIEPDPWMDVEVSGGQAFLKVAPAYPWMNPEAPGARALLRAAPDPFRVPVARDDPRFRIILVQLVQDPRLPVEEWERQLFGEEE